MSLFFVLALKLEKCFNREDKNKSSFIRLLVKDSKYSFRMIGKNSRAYIQ